MAKNYVIIVISITVYCLTIPSVNSDIENMPEFLLDEDEEDCFEPGSLSMDILYIPWNTNHRAQKTVPPGVILTHSKIPDGGLGIISETFIEKHTWLAEYEGEIIVNHDEISDYAWKVKRNGIDYFYIDAYNERTSNWLRWINCSRFSREENVVMFACRGKVYYVTSKDIYPGDELLVYYGDAYAKDLEIDVDHYYDNNARNCTIITSA